MNILPFNIYIIKSYPGYGDFDWVKFKSCFFTSIEEKKSNKAAEEGIFALPNTSANLIIFYYLLPENSWIYIYVYVIYMRTCISIFHGLWLY